MKMELTYENDEGEEVTFEVPAVNVVCDDCEGEGYVLTEGMRHHAYSVEEFNEAFDDDEEDREAYFTRGGKYDVACPTCKGKNVVLVPDEDHIPEDEKENFKAWQESEEKHARYEAEDRQTRRMENGGYE